MNSTEKTLNEQEAIDKFRALVEEVHVCMFTTVDEHAGLTSRPMLTASIDDEGNIWFFTNEFSEKIGDLSKDNVVHLIYSHPVKNVYVEVKGTCMLVIDRKKMEELWSPRFKAWFPQGIEDPKLCLVKVTTETAHYWNNSTSKMGLLFHMIKSIAKGDRYRENEKGSLELRQQEK